MKRSRPLKLNQKGFGHHIILPALVVVAVAAVGIRVLNASHAETVPRMLFANNNRIYTSTSTGPAVAILGAGAALNNGSNTDVVSTYALNSSDVFYLGASSLGLFSVSPTGTNSKFIATLPGTPVFTEYQSMQWSESAQRFYAWSITQKSARTTQRDKLVTFDATGTNVKTLYNRTDSMADSFGPWSPDGTKILHNSYDFTTHTTFSGYIDASNGTLRAIPHNPCYSMDLYEVAWMPNGTQIACIDGSSRMIDEVNVATGTHKTLATDKLSTTGIYGMSLSPDGRYLAYDTQKGTGPPGADCRMYIVNLATNNTKLVADMSARDCSMLDWSPNNNELAFSAESNASKNLPPAQVYTVSNRGTNLRSVFTASTGIAATPTYYQGVLGLNWATQ